jgi:hypothetical protein
MAWWRITRSVTARGSLRGLARWLFLVTLVAAPWLYGATTAWAIELVLGMLGTVLLLWAASLLLDRRWPMVPRPLVVIAGLILLQGWWMVANAHAIYDSTFGLFVPLPALVPSAAGSADFVLSFAWMVRASLLLGVVAFAAELAQRPVWLVRFWYAIAIAGGSIALLGLIQKGTGAQMIFWKPALPSDVKTFFATYHYHANAGAFLNLALPPLAGLSLWTFVRQSSSPFGRAGALTSLLLVLLASLSNTSRMAQLIGVVLALVMIGAATPRALRMFARAEKRSLIMAFVIVAITVLAIAQVAQLDQPLRRWQQFSEQLPQSARWTANRAALNGVSDAGVFGFGPGTFRAIFPHYQKPMGKQLRGSWRFLHDDYLQTILEWGWLGSTLVGALFFGGFGGAIRRYLKARRWSNRQRILVASVVLALMGVALHAFVDFPLQILSIQLFAATYLGICWGSVRWSEDSTGRG